MLFASVLMVRVRRVFLLAETDDCSPEFRRADCLRGRWYVLLNLYDHSYQRSYVIRRYDYHMGSVYHTPNSKLR
jgi:hypothetical protein